MTNRRRKGVVLLQTLVMSVLLSMMAVMLLKWILARYTMAAHNYRSDTTRARVGGYTQAAFSSWNFNAGPALPAVPDGKNIAYSPSGAGMVTVTMTSDEDQ